MTLKTGSRIGSYEVLEPIGSGGMGQVFRGRDTKLKRDVAIKVLPLEWSNDPGRLARAQREAEALATLNHPHIAQIYGQDATGDTHCLILEFVDGETIQERLRRGPIPLEEALEIARQIAEGLEATHERGIIHRDLKPANVKISSIGQVKILDFGLAKSAEPTAAQDLSHSPTLMSHATGAGVILGTSAYMSPEQARGKAVDPRTDIWSFGVLLYEMLTGKQGFPGETVIEVLGAVLKSDIDWTALPPDTPAIVRSVLRRCLQKDPKRRLRHIGDARLEIEEALTAVSDQTSIDVRRPARSYAAFVWGGLILVAIIATTIITGLYFRSSTPSPELRLQLVTPPGNAAYFDLSPDGRSIVFQAVVDGKTQLWLRPLDSDVARPIAGTDDAKFPFWSPDGRSLGFFADKKLKRIDIAGGRPQDLVDAANPIGATWGQEGFIVYGVGGNVGLRRVSETGGDSTEITKVNRPQETSHRLPQFLPDGRHFLFFVVGERRGVSVGSVDSTETRRLFDADSMATFMEPGYIVYMRGGTLFAQRFDASSQLATIGDPVAITKPVFQAEEFVGQFAASVSRSGVIAYRRAVEAKRQLTWRDRSGNDVGHVGEPQDGRIIEIRLSPDRRMVAWTGTGIMLAELARAVIRPFAFEPHEQAPVWSHRGDFIVYTSRRTGPQNLYKKAINGNTEELLWESSENKIPDDLSSDGRFLLFESRGTSTGTDLWVLPLVGDPKLFTLLQTTAFESAARFSPDGRWVIYQSNKTRRDEIYLRPFRGADVSLPISANGGTRPTWGRGGKEIYFVSADNHLMAVPVTLNSDPAQVEIGKPSSLFSLPPESDYDPDPDGQRFLVPTPLGDISMPPITIMVNWSGAKK